MYWSGTWQLSVCCTWFTGCKSSDTCFNDLLIRSASALRSPSAATFASPDIVLRLTCKALHLSPPVSTVTLAKMFDFLLIKSCVMFLQAWSSGTWARRTALPQNLWINSLAFYGIETAVKVRTVAAVSACNSPLILRNSGHDKTTRFSWTKFRWSTKFNSQHNDNTTGREKNYF